MPPGAAAQAHPPETEDPVAAFRRRVKAKPGKEKAQRADRRQGLGREIADDGDANRGENDLREAELTIEESAEKITEIENDIAELEKEIETLKSGKP